MLIVLGIDLNFSPPAPLGTLEFDETRESSLRQQVINDGARRELERTEG